ncbi:MAG: helical backbone metal receptor [Actinomycetota bacterium]
MMKKSMVIILSIFVLAAVVALSGCTSPQVGNATASPSIAPASQYPMTVTDDYARNATFAREPQRIVSLSSENTEILFALGLGDKVVGDNDYDNYPAEAVNKTKVGGLTNVNVEKVAALNPDVIFANTLNPKETIQKLDSMGYKVVVNNISTIQGIDSAILRVGKVCNANDNATRLVADIDGKFECF